MEDFKVENVSATNYLYFAKKDLVFVDCPSDTLAANVDGVCLGFLFIIRLAELSITQLNIASCLLPSLPPNSTVETGKYKLIHAKSHQVTGFSGNLFLSMMKVSQLIHYFG